jgi:hypothetical protein
MLEENNKNNNEHKQNSVKKYSSGRSEFTRDKLETDYHPKPRYSKMSLIRVIKD